MFKIVFKSNQVKKFNSLKDMCAFCALSERDILSIIRGEHRSEAIKHIYYEASNINTCSNIASFWKIYVVS